MKKTILALLLAASLLLAGCGAPDLGSAVSEPLSEAARQESGSESAEEQAADSDMAQTGAKRAPKIVIDAVYDSRYDYDLGFSFGNGLASLLYCGDKLETEDYESVRDDGNYPALSAALRAYNDEARRSLRSDLDEIENMARMDYASGNYPGADDYGMVYCREELSWLQRADSRLVSFMKESYWSAGGAHPYTGYQGLNFDSETGERLTINAVLSESGRADFPAVFETELFAQYPDFREGLLVDSVAGTIRQEMAEGRVEFTLDAWGMTVLISPYELASYANGPAFVRLSFADYPALFEPDYARTDENAIIEMRPQRDSGWYSPLNTVKLYTPTGERSLNVQYIPDNYELGRMCSLTVTLDGASWQADDFYGFSVSPYLFQVEGKNYLYLAYQMPNDWDALYVLDLNGSEPILLVSMSEAFGAQIPTDPYDFLLCTRSYCMSTYGIARSYSIAPDGRPVSTEELYTVTHAPTLTLRQPLGVTELTAEGGERQTTLAAGTELSFYRTNNSDLVELRDTEGRVYRVSYDRGEDYIGKVNGIPLTEAFDGVMFAG